MINQLKLGPTVSDRDKAIASELIVRKINELIKFLNLPVEEVEPEVVALEVHGNDFHNPVLATQAALEALEAAIEDAPSGGSGMADHGNEFHNPDFATEAALVALDAIVLNHDARHENGGADEINVAGLDGLLATPQTPAAHATSHQNGGADEMSVAGLSGLLGDAQTPLAHGNEAHTVVFALDSDLDALAVIVLDHDARHEDGGADEINVGGLSGVLADPQTAAVHAASHQNGGGDEIAVTGLSGLLGDPQTPLAHAASHALAGSDPVKLDDLAAPDDNTDLDASVAAHGLMQKYPGGTTNFLREDGTFTAPTASVDIKETEVDMGAVIATKAKSFTVVDLDVAPTSQIIATQSLAAPTGKSQDENEMDTLTAKAVAGTGQFTLFVESLFGSVVGNFKFNYLVG